MKHDSLIFDLDGTLWDSTEKCARAYNLGLERMGLPVLRKVTASDIASVTGLPFDQCVSTLFPEISQNDFERLIHQISAAKREIILVEGGRIYPGVKEGLKRLSRYFQLFLVSNCQRWYMDFFLSWSGFKSLFMDQESHGNTGKTKAENIAAIISRNRLSSPVYIGDTASDHASAMAAGIRFIHLNHGFGDPVDGVLSLDNFDKLVDYLLS